MSEQSEQSEHEQTIAEPSTEPTEVESSIGKEEERNSTAEGTALLAWDSMVKVLADADPVMAAGIAGGVALLVLVIFGRIGSLIVGLLGGLLLHASIERRRDDATWREKFNKSQPDII